MSEALISQRAIAKKENHDVNFIVYFSQFPLSAFLPLSFIVMTFAKLLMHNGVSHCNIVSGLECWESGDGVGEIIQLGLLSVFQICSFHHH